MSDLRDGMFTKPRKAAKNASDVPKAAPAAQKIPAAHAAAANIRRNKKSGFCRCSIEPLQKTENPAEMSHRGVFLFGAALTVPKRI